MLRRDGHEVLLIDLNNEAMTDLQVLTAIEEYNTDIVGLSVKTATMKDARSLAQQLKDSLPEMPLLVGGPHTKLAWREIAAEPWFDGVFIGEGESVFPNICCRLTAGEPIEHLSGVVTKRTSEKDPRPDGPLIAAAVLDTLPFPEYDLFPQSVKESLRTSYPLLTSRGCVYSCTYCSVPNISGRRFRKRNPASVIKELEWAHREYEVTHFEIIDDVFNLDSQRSKDLCVALIEADLGMTWSCPNGLRADRIDKELAELMSTSGCQSVMVGIESADPLVLARVKKGETIDDIERGIRILQKAGIHVGGYFIVGLPGDSFESQKRSVEFVKRMGIGGHFNMLVPYPGTELWTWANAEAHLLGDIEDGLHFADSSTRVNPVIETDDFSAAERKRAYEMVHAKLGRFDMLIPSDVEGWRFHLQTLWLLSKYDRAQVLGYTLRHIIGKLWQVVGKSIRLARQVIAVRQLL
jgi:radical SAM superfamily enzyme YgiQ (UPF0313 family)